MGNDWEQLQEFVNHDSQEAFRQVVAGNVNLVYSAARRQVRSEAMADDVTQAVFLILAKKAGTLGKNIVLPAWLLRTAHYVANNALRGERRRHKHEIEASLMRPETTDNPLGEWDDVAPKLDGALNQLRAGDRDAIVLRYFNGQSVREVGDALGVSEDAAKVRLSRAVGRLRDILKRRGSIISAATLTSGLESNVIQQAPAQLSNALQAMQWSSAVSGAGAASSLASGTLVSMKLLRAKMAAGILLVTTLAGISVVAVVSDRGARSEAAPATAPASAPAAQVVNVDPLGALGALSAALHNMDLAAARKCVVLGDDPASKIVDMTLAMQVARIRLESAVRSAHLDADVTDGSVSMEKVIDLVCVELGPDDVEIDGDKATVRFPVPKFLIGGDSSWENGRLVFARKDGRWMLALQESMTPGVTIFAANSKGLVQQIYGARAMELCQGVVERWDKTYEKFAEDVKAGKFKSSEAFQKAFDKQMRADQAKDRVTGLSITFLPKEPASAAAGKP